MNLIDFREIYNIGKSSSGQSFKFYEKINLEIAKYAKSVRSSIE